MKHAEQMLEMWNAGHTLAEIGARYELTRERIRQILKPMGASRKTGGRYFRVASATAKREAAKVAARERACQKWYGCDWPTFSSVSGRSELCLHYKGSEHPLLRAYWTHLRNAKRFGLAWAISYPKYLEIVGNDPLRITRGGFNLCRKDKSLGFTPENVEIIDCALNGLKTRQHAAAVQARAIALRAEGLPISEIAQKLRRAPTTIKLYFYKQDNLAA